jgi:hypothetical protein
MALILDGTNGLSDVDGSAATPAIRGSDANTGVFFGTDIVGVSTGGSERVRVDASGNVGIGTSSPSGARCVITTPGVNDASEIALSLNHGDGSLVVNQEVVLGFGQGGGTTAQLAQITSSYTGGVFNGDLRFRTNNAGTVAERMRIDSSGNLLVNRTSSSIAGSSARFAIDGNSETEWIAGFNNTRSGTGNTNFIVFTRQGTQTGSIANTGTTTSYNTSSDYRLKHDIQPMTGALAKVAQLKPVTYKWNADDSQSQGFIAHELQEVVPECVTGEKDAVDAEGKPVYQGIDTSFLVATLTAAIKEQQAIITALTARVEALEGAQTNV